MNLVSSGLPGRSCSASTAATAPLTLRNVGVVAALVVPRGARPGAGQGGLPALAGQRSSPGHRPRRPGRPPTQEIAGLTPAGRPWPTHPAVRRGPVPR